jgi:hypothetical protein
VLIINHGDKMTIQPSQVENQETSQAPVQKTNNTEINVGRLARQLEAEKEAREKLQQEISQLREVSQRRQREEDPEDSEPYVDERRLNKKLDRFAEDFDKKLDKRVEERAAMMIERERQQNFLKNNADFNAILGDEAILQKLVDQHPEIAEPLLEMPDNFARKKLVYQNIKALGLHKPDVQKQSIQEKIDANRRSPYYQPSSGASTPPYGNSGDFSAAGQKNAYAKMKSLMTGKSF